MKPPRRAGKHTNPAHPAIQLLFLDDFVVLTHNAREGVVLNGLKNLAFTCRASSAGLDRCRCAGV
jgi:hypothetical protein